MQRKISVKIKKIMGFYSQKFFMEYFFNLFSLLKMNFCDNMPKSGQSTEYTPEKLKICIANLCSGEFINVSENWAWLRRA